MFQGLEKPKTAMNKIFRKGLRAEIKNFKKQMERISEGVKSGKSFRLDPDQYSNDVRELALSVNDALDSISEEEGKKATFYLSILDALPAPLSVTDLDENLTFINKTTEEMINVKRGDVLGMHCSNWGADICNTERCGIKALRRGESNSVFKQNGGHFKLLVSYLRGPDGNVFGHLETVVDITDQVVVADSVNKLIGDLSFRVDSVNEAMREGMEATEQMLNIAEQISQSCLHRNENIAQIVEVMEDLSVSVAEAATRSHQVSTEASQANEYSSIGMKQALKSGEVMLDVTESTHMLDLMIKDINAQMVEIGKIVQLISNISDQTNLLALNAAIEAARAGDAGRGFAVVANEVKTLAQNSRRCAESIAGMIFSLQETATKANQATSQTTTVAHHGKEAIDKNLLMFEKIAISIGDMNQHSLDVAAFAERQAAAVEEATVSISTASSQSQESTSQVREMSAAVQETRVAIAKVGEVFDEVHTITEEIHRTIAKLQVDR
jgi:methyl-accepting chemotaxis protein